MKRREVIAAALGAGCLAAGRAGALAQGWRRWQSGYDHVAVVDADTALAPDCLQELEGELWRSSRPGRVTARYTADRTLGSTAVARLVTRTLHPGAAAVLPADRARVLGGDPRREGSRRSIVELTIHEGRNRIVRRLLDHVGHPVRRLTRTEIGPVTLARLRSGEMRELTVAELGELMDVAHL